MELGRPEAGLESSLTIAKENQLNGYASTPNTTAIDMKSISLQYPRFPNSQDKNDKKEEYGICNIYRVLGSLRLTVRKTLAIVVIIAIVLIFKKIVDLGDDAIAHEHTLETEELDLFNSTQNPIGFTESI